MIEETLKELKDDTKEILKERFFSPMYFYFILAWLISNWDFLYVLLFTDESLILGTQKNLKVDYLKDLYPLDSLWTWIHLIIGPAMFAYFAVWYLSNISEAFYKRYEQYKQNKRVIEKELLYEEKVKVAKKEREIRDLELDLKLVDYDGNPEFNKSLDSILVNVLGYSFLPSTILYDQDIDAYKEALEEWKQEQLKEGLRDKIKDEVRGEIIEEYNDDMRAQADDYRDEV